MPQIQGPPQYCFLSRTIDHQSITEDCRVGMDVAFHSCSISLCPFLPFLAPTFKIFSFDQSAAKRSWNTNIFIFACCFVIHFGLSCFLHGAHARLKKMKLIILFLCFLSRKFRVYKQTKAQPERSQKRSLISKKCSFTRPGPRHACFEQRKK